MKKVDFNANTEWLYQQNWRLFQRALVELDIRNYVRSRPAPQITVFAVEPRTAHYF